MRQNREEINLVILDLSMPRMDGAEAFREMQSIVPDLPIAVSSGYTMQRVAEYFTGQHPACFIQKPYTLTLLQESLQFILPQGE